MTTEQLPNQNRQGGPMLSPSPLGPSPVSKFDYVTRLVSHHDSAITRQNVLISELVQRVNMLEDAAKQSGSQNATLVQQNVQLCQELQVVKKGMEKAHKAQAKQEKAWEDRERRLNEAAAEREKAAVDRERTASSETHMLQTGLLQAEVDKLKQQVDGLRCGMDTIVTDRVSAAKASVTTGLERQLQAAVAELHREVDAARAHVLKDITNLRGQVEQDIACIRAESSASASSVEASALAANSLGMKLRNHMQATSTAEAAAAAKFQEIQSSIAGLSDSLHKAVGTLTDTVHTSTEGLESTVAHVSDDTKKVKKHVVKLERVVEGLHSLGHVAVAADKALHEVKRGCDQTAASVQAIKLSSQEAVDGVQATLLRIAEVESQLVDAAELGASNRTDLGDMAESLGASFHQFHEGVRKGLQHHAQQYQQLQQYLQQCLQLVQQQLQQQPTSYLQSLLGPGPLASTSAMSMARMQLLGNQQQPVAPVTMPAMPQQAPEQGTWEAGPTDFDAFLRQFRSRSHSESGRVHVRSDSPVHRRSSAAAGSMRHRRVS